MNKLLQWIDKLIEQIPTHTQDLIQKLAILCFAFFSLIAIIIGVFQGKENASAGGLKILKNVDDIFYLKQIEEINHRHKKKLVEDIEYDFFSASEKKLKYMTGRKSKSNHLQGEPDGLVSPKNSIRRNRKDIPFIPDEDTNHKNYLTTDEQHILPSNPMIDTGVRMNQENTDMDKKSLMDMKLPSLPGLSTKSKQTGKIQPKNMLTNEKIDVPTQKMKRTEKKRMKFME